MSKQVFVSNPPFIEIRCSEPVPYYFARRAGKDSVAVLLWRRSGEKSGYEVLLRYQPLVHLADGDSKELFPCPITGSMEPGESPLAAAIREAEEESGYQMMHKRLVSMGHYIVGTQTDEVVFMYAADVTDEKPGIPIGDGTFHESISNNQWVDWREAVIIAQYSGLIILLHRAEQHLFR